MIQNSSSPNKTQPTSSKESAKHKSKNKGEHKETDKPVPHDDNDYSWKEDKSYGFDFAVYK